MSQQDITVTNTSLLHISSNGNNVFPIDDCGVGWMTCVCAAVGWGEQAAPARAAWMENSTVLYYAPKP